MLRRYVYFSTTVDLENDCCEIAISNESFLNCDINNVSMIISKVRKIARSFCKSPLNNHILQMFKRAWKKFRLMLDSKTMRNSLLALKAVKFGAEKLGDQSSMLLSAECIFSFIPYELELLNNPLSLKLHEVIIKRIEQRRNSNLVGMLHYINSEHFCQFLLTKLY